MKNKTKNKIKDKKIRALSVVVAMLTLLEFFPLMFEFVDLNFSPYDSWIRGLELYANKQLWWFLVMGILGLIALIWNLLFAAYSIIDGRYKKLTWNIARYGYFYGVVVGFINFVSLTCCQADLMGGAYAFLFFLTAIIALEIALIFSKDEDTKNSLKMDNEDL